mmetsp:Transcript_59651/g.158745  ORF Transcript_59651/g.158745 Transcript_59651/m.158745 type:complete len:200 (+) Transcript_59651:253-852(+)
MLFARSEEIQSCTHQIQPVGEQHRGSAPSAETGNVITVHRSEFSQVDKRLPFENHFQNKLDQQMRPSGMVLDGSKGVLDHRPDANRYEGPTQRKEASHHATRGKRGGAVVYDGTQAVDEGNNACVRRRVTIGTTQTSLHLWETSFPQANNKKREAERRLREQGHHETGREPDLHQFPACLDSLVVITFSEAFLHETADD